MTPRNVHPWAAGLLLILAAGACDFGPTSSLVCTDQFVYGITIEVTDSLSGLAVTDSISGTLVDGTFSEQMVAVGGTLAGAGEREGTYSASVEAPGYTTWAASGIVVTGDECHVTPVGLSARLQSS